MPVVYMPVVTDSKHATGEENVEIIFTKSPKSSKYGSQTAMHIGL